MAPSSKGKRKVHKVMKEHKGGTLKSGSGKKVKSRKAWDRDCPQRGAQVQEPGASAADVPSHVPRILKYRLSLARSSVCRMPEAKTVPSWRWCGMAVNVLN
jgi:hypothetical protein